LRTPSRSTDKSQSSRRALMLSLNSTVNAMPRKPSKNFKARTWVALKLQSNGPREAAASVLKTRVDLHLVALNQSVTTATKLVTLHVIVAVVVDRVRGLMRDAQVVETTEIGRVQEVIPDISVAHHQEVVVPHQHAMEEITTVIALQIDVVAAMAVKKISDVVEDLDRAAWKEVPAAMIEAAVTIVRTAEAVTDMNLLVKGAARAKSVLREAQQ